MKGALAVCAFALAALVFSPICLADEAGELTADSVFSASGGSQSSAAVADRTRGTKWRTEDGGRLEITMPRTARGLYLVWDDAPPDGWRLLEGGASSGQGENGFLHEYVPLEGVSPSLTLTWEGQAVLCDVYLFETAAPLPDWVQRWQPPCDKADLLLLPTHADDEHLWFGGTMPVYAGERGLRVQVAYMTRHHAEPYRLHEQLDGLWSVGVTHYPVVPDFPDIYSESLEHAKTVYSEEAITAYQVGLLRRFRPSVVIGHDIEGEYGHGGHRLNTACLQNALELAADSAAYPEGLESNGVWDVPKTYLHLYAENPVVMNWDEPLAAFGGKTGFEMAVEGFAYHKSQTASGVFAVAQSGPYDCRKFGLYRSKVGPDVTKDNFMENIPLTAQEEEDLANAPPDPPAPESPAPEETPPPAEPGPAAPNRISTALLLTVPLLASAGAVAGCIFGVKYRRKRRKPL